MELIVQYLDAHPAARILLCAQSNIAVDRVADAVAGKIGDRLLLRVAATASDKVTAEGLRHTARYVVPEWRADGRRRAEEHLDRFFARHGVDLAEIRAAERLREVAALVHRWQLAARSLERRRAGSSDDPRATGDVDVLRAGMASIASAIEAHGDDPVVRDRLDARFGSLDPTALDAGLLTDMASELERGSGAGVDSTALVEALDSWWSVPDDQVEEVYTAGASVVAGTCVGVVGAPGVAAQGFDLCIVDEATRASATELLVPMARASQWVLVGDDRQLPPYVDSELWDEGFRDRFGDATGGRMHELFSWLEAALPPENRFALENQYRMHPAIGRLVSECFYGGAITTYARDGERREGFAPPVSWLSTSRIVHQREQRVRTGSFYNGVEARAIARWLRRFVDANPGGDHPTVTVLTPYREQVAVLEQEIWNTLRGDGIEPKISTVDAAQGWEADVVLVSPVRSNENARTGFIAEERRINVALSRARDTLCIVGDGRFFEDAGGPLGTVYRFIRAHPELCSYEELT